MNTNKTTLTIGALLGSVTLNIFALGFTLGHHVDRELPAGQMPPMPPHDMLAHMERVLPPEDARIFDAEMHRDLPLPKDDAATAAAFKAVRETLLAPEFSPADFRQALERAHAQRALMDKGFTDALTKAVTLVSPEGRRKLAAALPDHPPAFEGEHGGPPEGERPLPPPGP